ncbi:heparin cofactor 2-like, partial [Notechis scutatus]|uniref:Heparin cofactor 2-like n=1 Tax=Notechis scutatus TaxID=8663 RepID=A0A6J1W391_9SAUR
MKIFWHSAVFFSLTISLVWCDIKDLHGHFDLLSEEALSFHPHGLLSNKSLQGTNLSPEYHQENTVTNDLSMEEEENYEYLDFDKLLREDDYIDIIDSIPEATSYADQGNVLALFRGKTRIQRLNILNAYFGFNLYRSLRDHVNSSDNIFLAPVGISTAMAMVSLGLGGRTQKEVLDVLGFEDFVNASSTYDYMTVHNLFHKLTHRLFRRNFGYTLRSVNDLYVQ